jgi:hypothetical protein
MGRASWLALAICMAAVITACGGASKPQAAGAGGGSAKTARAPLCAQGTTLSFDYKKAANVKDANGNAIGADGAKSLVQELGDTDSVCGLDVSPDTQKVIDDAQALVQQGKKTDALALIDAETTRVIALPTVAVLRYGTRGMALAATDKATQKARDLLALGGAAQDAGGAGARQLAEAQAIYGPELEARLQSADWQEAVKIAAEAEKLGLDDLEKRAQARVASEVGKMADDARANFDVCLATDAQVKRIVTLLALAQMTLQDGAAPIQTITGVLNDTAAANILLHTNKLPPDCARWNIKFTYSSVLTAPGGSVTWSGQWTGTFQVGKTGKFDGTAVGAWSTSLWTCLVGSDLLNAVGRLEPASGTVKATLSGELKDDKFHLVPATTLAVTPAGCLLEDMLPDIENPAIFGNGVDLFAQESGEDGTIVIDAKDGAVASREYSEQGADIKVTVTLTKRPAAGG